MFWQKPFISILKEQLTLILLVLSGALAARARLRTRGINIDPTCPACGRGPEDIAHVLFHCNFEKEVWAYSTIPMPPSASTNQVCWQRPPSNWLKFNVASSWVFDAPLSGAAWLVRNDEGRVLLHSRRAFTRLASPLNVELHALLWSVESMASHHFHQVIFETSSLDLRMALLRPKLFPQFRHLISSIDLRVDFAKTSRNLAALSIATSVTSDHRSQSYVASGGPLWLNNLLFKEASATTLGTTSLSPAGR
uniref:Reverse transcriptase zinc-binding domain-containing protein n=1 Tax=Brassica oleracea TaxID=3712 RepID=A0A3P6FDX5_BRAOL|nr:unnamed protein product [Brassica oleracea]